MTEEMVDIVDEFDNYIKTVPRSKMREDHLGHRASYIAYVNGQNQFLVEIRTLKKDYAPGKFDVCIGGVYQSGEDFTMGAKRELLEEVGIDADKIDFYPLGSLKIPTSDRFIMGRLFFAHGNCISKKQYSEVSGVMFLTYEQILKLKDNCAYDSFYAFEHIIQRAMEQNLYAK